MTSERPRKRRKLSECLSDYEFEYARESAAKRPRIELEEEVAAINRDIEVSQAQIQIG